MMRRRINLLLGCGFFLILWQVFFLPLGFSAESSPKVDTTSGPGSQSVQTAAENSAYNDYACFLAGLRNPASTLAARESSPAWQEFAGSEDRAWERFAAKQLGPMKEWAAKELGADQTHALFYPFSGPDFINPSALFPQAATYVLVGLEPPGVLPDLGAIDFNAYFTSLKSALADYLYIDFFSTARMRRQIGQSELEGVLPVLLFFLAREQCRVRDIRYLALKPDGTLEQTPALDGSEPPGGGIPGGRIVFQGPGSAGNQTLYYFRLNLQNGPLARNPQFLSFLQSLGPLTTFTKAASYLLFSPYSSVLRQFILDHSRYVLQGDSGIPLKYFDPAVWRLRFYGTYLPPIAPFQDRFYQQDLADIYAQGKDVFPLPFGIGYHFRPGTSNLMWAVKKGESASK